MQAYPNYNPNSQLDYSAEQQRFLLGPTIKIDDNDPMWTFLEVIREVTFILTVRKEKYKSSRFSDKFYFNRQKHGKGTDHKNTLNGHFCCHGGE